MSFSKLQPDHIFQKDRTINVSLFYPDCDQNINSVEIALVDIRSADSILILYDKERDGWVIKQASKFEFEIGEEINLDWQEVAFVQAWARENSTR